jgi:hypothetical protein
VAGILAMMVPGCTTGPTTERVAPPLPLKAHPDSAQWPDLFRADLSDATFPAGVWSFTNGVLTATEDHIIWSKAEHGDCMLDLEFKLDPGANSGVFVYNSNPTNWMPNTVEIQLLDDFSPKWSKVAKNWQCGGIFGHTDPLQQSVKPAGEWNRLTIACQGPWIQVLLNNVLVTDADLRHWTSATNNPDGSKIPEWLRGVWADLPQKGRVGLQGRHAGAGIYFRNLKLLDLPKMKSP